MKRKPIGSTGKVHYCKHCRHWEYTTIPRSLADRDRKDVRWCGEKGIDALINVGICDCYISDGDSLDAILGLI